MQHDGQTTTFAPCGELVHVPIRERRGVDGTRMELVQGLVEAAHHGAEIYVPDTLRTG